MSEEKVSLRELVEERRRLVKGWAVKQQQVSDRRAESEKESLSQYKKSLKDMEALREKQVNVSKAQMSSECLASQKAFEQAEKAYEEAQSVALKKHSERCVALKREFEQEAGPHMLQYKAMLENVVKEHEKALKELEKAREAELAGIDKQIKNAEEQRREHDSARAE